MPAALTAPPPPVTATDVATRLLDAIVSYDPAALRTLLADDVWFRAMLVREVVQRHDAQSTVAVFDGWLQRATDVQVLHRDVYPIGTRHHLTYRLLLRPDWAPDVVHLIEQTGYVRVHDGHVRRIDLTCTGFTRQP